MDTQLENDAGMVVRESIPSSDTVRVRFGEIDGLRAIAILALLVFEATRFASPGSHWQPILGRLFSDSSQGFSLFFLLSGFVLAYPALATLRVDGCTYLDVGRYFVKRLLRIYPAYALVLALTFAVPAFAIQYGLPALATGTNGLGLWTFVQNFFFVGTGLGNDGFRILALEVRWCILFPGLLILWARLPRVFLGAAAAVAVADLLVAPAHAFGLGSLVPFMLGIAAADVRAGRLRFERLGFIVAGVGVLAAIVVEPFSALLPGPAGAPGALRFDPLWSVALFGFLVGAGTSGVAERVLSQRILRMLGAASFGISLVMVPISAFIVRETLALSGPPAAALQAALVSLIAGCIVWQLADRWFAEGNLRRDAADAISPRVDALFRLARIDRVTLGALTIAVPEPSVHEDVDASFYAPPPRPASGDLASVSMRSGSPEDLAAEIMEMKKRLSDRSTALFAEAEVPHAEPEAIPVETEIKPGFYRKPQPASDGVAKPATPAPPVAPRRTIGQASEPLHERAAPVAPKPSNVTPIHAYVEPQPISLSFEAKAPIEPVAPAPQPPAAEYQHFTFEPATSEPAAPAASVEPPLPVPPALEAPAPPPSRGPIKMRLGPVASPNPSANGNGKHHKVNDIDG